MIQPSPDFSLTGRRALISGSSRGIGLAIAHAFADAGAEVVLNGRDTQVLDAAVATLKSEGYNASGQAFDVTDENAVNAARDAIGSIDILVNNAGIQRRSALVDMSLADWEKVISTNLTSAFLVSRAFVPDMIESKAGKIINVCSLMSDLARPTTANYAAAKGGLKMLTRAMCGEWAQHNIQINGIGPGYIATELTAPLMADDKFDSWIKGRTPAGRWGKVSDLTGAAVFMASSASDFLNGQILMIDGGLTAVI
ncbi:SDR family oxidoreductase [Opitutaceae bacterium]|nr:SDR family oxidoreductase [Opitutaceae bacterium]